MCLRALIVLIKLHAKTPCLSHLAHAIATQKRVQVMRGKAMRKPLRRTGLSGGGDGSRSTQQAQQGCQLAGALSSIACHVVQLSDRFQIHVVWSVALLLAAAYLVSTK